jgi:miniconductance mechanosensitive channel
MTRHVRQRAPGPQRLPIEVYCNSDTSFLLLYDEIHAALFDPLVAIVPEYGPRLNLEPAGADVSGLADRLNTREINAE